ncbi:MAG: molecular chaperone HtpG [Flexistipes sinusarabici]|uniref:Chaperone protein HtpG n=1 Tax=Flexistipes sinusarabici TaxID=2352 RepID=A0A5D0MPF5_FLESI|nr:molecular chaperone HtpG [Flexistipes sinusarabici]TYB33188.1 MAG: molecular chaperone HtpG [Flexistipes sinusarabici]
MAETVQFQAEVKELLNLVINSLYTHKEIFLRELISNASDAIDKAKYLSITDKSNNLAGTEWKIKIKPDKDEGTITISDNGIGLSRDEAVKSLGTIAHSGTKEFINAVKSGQIKEQPELIGQFGVGFYSAFMVADKITVISKKVGEEKGVKWESAADGTFTVDDADKENFGTDVTVTLKKDEREFLDEWRIKEIVKKYSDYIEYPITMDVEKEDKDGNKSLEEETLNSMKALWLKDKSEITESEYNEFYKHISHDFTDPLETIHFKAEGTQEFSALLYIPSHAPFDIFYKDFKFGPALYVKKVQIMDHCEELIPPYLRFIKGVVDSSDLPLNISREILQNNRKVEVIKKNITKKVLETLKKIKENESEKYEKFVNEFGKILKEGIHYDFSRKEEIAGLLTFHTTKTAANEKIDFDKYLENMKENQEEIYYICGDSVDEVKNSPYLERFKEKDIEVIFFTDEIDDMIMSTLGEYKGKTLKSVLKGDINLDEEEKKETENREKELKGFLDSIRDLLKGKVKDVKISNRLKDSPACLVVDEDAMDPAMKKLLESMGQEVPSQEKTLEINAEHPVVKQLEEIYETDPNSGTVSEYTDLLYNLSLVVEGEKPENPSGFVKKLSEMMSKSLKS